MCIVYFKFIAYDLSLSVLSECLGICYRKMTETNMKKETTAEQDVVEMSEQMESRREREERGRLS